MPVINVFFPPHTIDETARIARLHAEPSQSVYRRFFYRDAGGAGGPRGLHRGRRSDAILQDVHSQVARVVHCSRRHSEFQLVFKDVKPPILGDSSFRDVPVGIDLITWPLDINVQYIKRALSVKAA